MNIFLSGLFFLLPVVLTMYVMYYISKQIYSGLDFVVAFVPEPYKSSVIYKFLVILATIVIIFFFIVLIGVFIRTVFGKAIERVIDRVFGFIPGVKGLYNMLKQIFNLLFRRGEGQHYKPVLVQYPHKDSWALAFLTGKCTADTSPDTDRNYYSVFMPTTPNPTSGFMLIFPEEDIIHPNLTASDAIKLIMSGGIVKK